MSVGRPLSRRAALALGSAGLLAAATACDSRGDGSPQEPAEDPDAELVDRVTAQIAAAEQVATSARMDGLAELHRQHLATLDSAATGPSASPNAGSAPAGRAAVVRTERQLAGTLAAAAVDAKSGQLARVLASMAAAVDQRVARLAGSPS